MGHEKIVEFLLENGADINAVASSDVSAMWLAASEGRVGVMRILVKNNAEASNTRVDGISSLMTAAVSPTLQLFDIKCFVFVFNFPTTGTFTYGIS